MKNRKTLKKFFKWFLKVLLATGIAFVVAIFVSVLDQSILSRMTINTTNRTFIESYYDYVNSRGNKSYGSPNDHIIIYDSDSLRIEQLPRVLETLVACKPKVIGLDIYTPDITGIKESAVDSLARTVRRCYDRVREYGGDIIFNSVILKDTLQCSYYLKDNYEHYKNSVTFANIEDIDLLSPTNESMTRRIEDNEYSFFPLKVAECFLQKEIDFSGQMINYRNKSDFRRIKTIDKISPKRVEGNIVLIGDSQSPLDWHYLPISIYKENYHSIQGIDLNAYILNSFIYQDGEKASQSKAYNKPYRTYGEYHFLNLLFSFIFVLIYSCITGLPEYFSSIPQRISRLIAVLRPFVLFGSLALLLIISYYFTSEHLYVPNIFIGFLSSVFVDYAFRIIKEFRDCFYKLFSKLKRFCNK